MLGQHCHAVALASEDVQVTRIRPKCFAMLYNCLHVQTYTYTAGRKNVHSTVTYSIKYSHAHAATSSHIS